MGSLEVTVLGSAARYNVKSFEDYVAEGVVGAVRSMGSISKLVPQIKTGIRNCTRSLGYRNLEELHEAVFSGEILLGRMSEAGKKRWASTIW